MSSYTGSRYGAFIPEAKASPDLYLDQYYCDGTLSTRLNKRGNTRLCRWQISVGVDNDETRKEITLSGGVTAVINVSGFRTTCSPSITGVVLVEY